MLGMVSSAVAQQYPDRPVRLIVPFAPGGTTDILARILGQRLSENLGQQIVIDSRGGAGGNLGTALAAKAPPDGYTLLLGVISPLAINVSLYGNKLPYNPVRDFAPISLITKVPQVISLHPSVPAKTVQQLIALGKAHPGKLTFGSAGVGTSNHLVGELLNVMTGMKMVHVPYKSAGLASVAVFSGEVDMMISAPPAVMQFFKAGRMRPLAVTSASRSLALPEVPTMIESGLRDFEATAWYCMVAPAGTPRSIIDKVHGALVRALDAPQLRQRLLDEGATPESSTPEELGAFMRSEIDKWDKVVKRAGVRLEN
jgi:tripartite-type tricarboxylate transporter receptor subunit TctC